MKIMKFWQSLLLAFVLLPATVSAQGFNNIYTFQTPYRSSVHTDAVQVRDHFIVEAGTILDPNTGTTVVEIGMVGTVPSGSNGLVIPPAYYVSDPNNAALLAVDLVECAVIDNQVVQVADYYDAGAGFYRLLVFKVDPLAGTILWARKFGNGLPYNLTGAAITKDANGDYYVLGKAIDASGFFRPYLTKLTGGAIPPVVVWEKLYSDPITSLASHEGVDLLYDQGSIVFTTNRALYPPLRPLITEDGVVTIEVSSATGNVITASHLRTLNGTTEVVATDMDLMFNGQYAIVGRINTTTSPSMGFLLRYNPGLAAFNPTIYPPVSGGSFYLTGVKPFNGPGGIMTSFEWINPGGQLVPGMIALNTAGPAVNPGIYYNVPGNATYIVTKGLIAMNNNQDFAVKGSIMANGVGSLSLFSEFGPFAPPNPAICENAITVNSLTDNPPPPIPFQQSNLQTVTNISLSIQQINGNEFDCNLNNIGSFRLAATGIEETEGSHDISIYPNPSTGNFTLEMSPEMAGQYQTGEIYNVLGEVISTFNVNSPIEKISLSGQVPGIYLLRLKSANGKVSEAKRIMIK